MILKPLVDFLGIQDPSFSSPSSPVSLLDMQLDKLDCDKIGRCCEWLTEKVDSLCMQIKPDEKNESGAPYASKSRPPTAYATLWGGGHLPHHEDMSDIDLWTLAEASIRGQPPTMSLVINDKWLAHLSSGCR